MLQPIVRADFGQRVLVTALSRPAALGAAVFAWLAATAWLRPLSLPDEGRYVGVAFEMLWSGNWLVPTLDTLPYFHKPPLFYWTTAASLAAFGSNEWAARLARRPGGDARCLPVQPRLLCAPLVATGRR